VKILLHYDVAAAGELGILLTDYHGIDGCLARRIFRSVDKSEEIAVVEVTESVHLVCRRDRMADTRHDLRGQLEAQIHALRADVE
jgi:hypothetical protein